MKRMLALAAVVLSGSVMAESGLDPFTGGSAEAGAAKAAVCGACHGPGGNSANPEWPKLAGQHSTYTFNQLALLKSGARLNPVMNSQAVNLSEQDMRDLAAYFAVQAPAPGIASPDSVAIAQRLYQDGDASRALPACAACHGPKGAGNAGAGYPRIGGQHATYTGKILRDLRGMHGKPAANHGQATMSAVAAKLNDAEINALASYINGLQ